jgi:hypothetical protein
MNERAAQKKTKEKPISLSMKDISKLVALLGIVASAIAWVHAEVAIPRILKETSIQIQQALEDAIPRILQKTSAQTEDAIEDHSGFPHPVSASRREFEMMKDSIESSIGDFKQDTRQRLGRIEQKLDQL